MVFRGRLHDRPVLLSVKDTSVSLAVGDDWIGAWDVGGRLYSLWKGGHTYRRGLNGRILHKWRDEGRGARDPYDARQRVHVEGEDADALVQESVDVLRGTLTAVTGDPSTWLDAAGRRP